MQVGRVLIHGSHRTRAVKVPHVIFLHDCPFKGLESLPEFIYLTPRCQFDSPLHHAAVRFDSPLHHAAVGFDSLLHHAVVRFDSLLHNAAERFDSLLQNAVGKFDSPLHHTADRFDSPLQYAVARFDSLLLRDLTPRCIMQRGVKL